MEGGNKGIATNTLGIKASLIQEMRGRGTLANKENKMKKSHGKIITVCTFHFNIL
jgi:hypothetical protein